MFKQTIVLLLLIAVCNATVTGWRDCGSHLANLYRIRIDGCTHTPCRFVRGQSYLIEVDASSRTNTHTLRFAAQAMILGMPITLLEGNACNHLSAGSCPALLGDHFTFSIVFDFPQNLPPINILVNTLLWNDYGDIAVCVELAVLLV